MQHCEKEFSRNQNSQTLNSIMVENLRQFLTTWGMSDGMDQLNDLTEEAIVGKVGSWET